MGNIYQIMFWIVVGIGLFAWAFFILLESANFITKFIHDEMDGWEPLIISIFPSMDDASDIFFILMIFPVVVPFLALLWPAALVVGMLLGLSFLARHLVRRNRSPRHLVRRKK